MKSGKKQRKKQGLFNTKQIAGAEFHPARSTFEGVMRCQHRDYNAVAKNESQRMLI